MNKTIEGCSSLTVVMLFGRFLRWLSKFELWHLRVSKTIVSQNLGLDGTLSILIGAGFEAKAPGNRKQAAVDAETEVFNRISLQGCGAYSVRKSHDNATL